MTLLKRDEIDQFLRASPNWSLHGNKLVREWEFANFIKAIEFVNDISRRAELANHHPDIDIRYNRVRLYLTSHDAGGITPNDISFAQALN